MSEWAELQLSDICNIISTKTSMTNASLENYVSTENMVSNFGGLVKAEKLPSGTMVNAFLEEDVLFSNIRTYFKKVWFAQFNGTVSADVLVFRAKQICDPQFLYYILCEPDFTEYTVLTSRGAKMPRGDKEAILSYKLDFPPLPEQKAIASVLSSLDDKIDLLHRQNKTLEAMAETLFRQWFIEDETLAEVIVSELIEFNPKRSLSKGTDAIYLEMAGLSTQSFNSTGYYRREFSSGTKFVQQDTLLARITPCLENGKAGYVTFLNDYEVGWGSTEYIVMRPKAGIHPLMAYVLCRNQDFKDYAESCMEGSSGRQRVNVDHLKEFTIGKPSDDVIQQFNDYLESIEAKLIYNSKQIQTLENLRDTLLPKLMSGEVRVQYQTEDVA